MARARRPSLSDYSFLALAHVLRVFFANIYTLIDLGADARRLAFPSFCHRAKSRVGLAKRRVQHRVVRGVREAGQRLRC